MLAIISQEPEAKARFLSRRSQSLHYAIWNRVPEEVDDKVRLSEELAFLGWKYKREERPGNVSDR